MASPSPAGRLPQDAIETRTAEELERLWVAAEPPPRHRGRVERIVLRTGGGDHATPAGAHLTREAGAAGDRWAAGPSRILDRQATLVMNVVPRESMILGRREYTLTDLDGVPGGITRG